MGAASRDTSLVRLSEATLAPAPLRCAPPLPSCQATRHLLLCLPRRAAHLLHSPPDCPPWARIPGVTPPHAQPSCRNAARARPAAHRLQDARHARSAARPPGGAAGCEQAGCARLRNNATILLATESDGCRSQPDRCRRDAAGAPLHPSFSPPPPLRQPLQLASHLTADEMRMVLPRRPLKPRTFRVGSGQVRGVGLGLRGAQRWQVRAPVCKGVLVPCGRAARASCARCGLPLSRLWWWAGHSRVHCTFFRRALQAQRFRSPATPHIPVFRPNLFRPHFFSSPSPSPPFCRRSWLAGWLASTCSTSPAPPFTSTCLPRTRLAATWARPRARTRGAFRLAGAPSMEVVVAGAG